MKKILVIHGSHRRSGLTQELSKRVTEPLETFAEVVEAPVVSIHVSHCLACLACSVTGVCVLTDEMKGLYAAFEVADVIVLTTPVYFNHVSSRLKQVIDRMEPYFYRKMKLGMPPKAKLFCLVCSSGVVLHEDAQKGILSTVTLLAKAFNSSVGGVVWIEETDKWSKEVLKVRFEEQLDQMSQLIQQYLSNK